MKHKRKRQSLESLIGLRPIGRHALVLAGGALIHLIYGAQIIILDTAYRPGLETAFAWLSADTWGVIWIITGFLAFLSARWPPSSKETWGYTTMSSLSALWSGLHGVPILLGHSTLSEGFSGTLVWGMVAFLWWGVSGLRNPEDVLKTAREQR